VMIDRGGEQVEFGVTPDEEILSEATISNNDPVIRRASQWLSEQTVCTSRRTSGTATSKPLSHQPRRSSIAKPLPNER